MRDRILDEVAYHYLESPDFNGIPIASLIQKLSADPSSVVNGIIDLVDDQSVNVVFGDDDDPYIFRTSFRDRVDQMAALPSADTYRACVYPAADVLRNFVVPENFAGRPYTLALALGDSQFGYRSFDLEVLEEYRSSPDFYYVNDDLSGLISATAANGERSPEIDRPLLRSFGFSYDESLNRGLAAFLRYLSQLPPGHQSLWRRHELPSSFQIHSVYHQTALHREPPISLPILRALLLEMFFINKMALAMGRSKLFRVDFGQDWIGLPLNLSLLIRPTTLEFQAFVEVLDEILVQNLDPEFFREEAVPSESQSKPKSGLNLLDSWMRRKLRRRERKNWDAGIESLWHLRSLRLIYRRQQSLGPADDASFNQQLFKIQRALIIRVYKAVRTIRLAFENDPAGRSVSPGLTSSISSQEVLTL